MKKGLHDDDVSSKYQAQGCITRAVQEFLIFFLKNFQTQDNFENIYYKCIPLCKYVCLELSFKVSQRLKLSAFSCQVLFLVKILKPVWEEKFIRDSNPQRMKNDVTILKPARWQVNNANYRKVLFNNTLQLIELNKSVELFIYILH